MRLPVRAALLSLTSLLLCSHPTSVSAAPLAYVTNEKDGVAVIDLDAMRVERTIGVGGEGPRGLGITADGRYLVSANKGTSDLSVIDTGSGEVVRRIPVGKNVEFVRVYGDFAYVTYEPGGAASPAGGPPAGKPAAEPRAGKPAAEGKSTKPGKDDDDDGDKLPAQIAVVDLKQGKVIRSIVAGHETEGVEFSLDGKQILVANEGDNTVTVFDRAGGGLIRRIDISAEGYRPRGIKGSPDGKTYAVTLESSSRVLLIDSNLKIIRSAPTKTGPYGVSFDPTGTRIYVAASRDGVIQVFDASTLAVLGEIPVGARCWHFSLNPEGSRLIAACGKSDTLVIADTATFQVLKTLPGAQAPWGVVTFPRARGSIDSP